MLLETMLTYAVNARLLESAVAVYEMLLRRTAADTERLRASLSSARTRVVHLGRLAGSLERHSKQQVGAEVRRAASLAGRVRALHAALAGLLGVN